MRQTTINKFRPMQTRKAHVYNALVGIYESLRENTAIGGKALGIATEIEHFGNGHWLHDHPTANLKYFSAENVNNYLPHMRRKVALFKALVAFVDAVMEHIGAAFDGEEGSEEEGGADLSALKDAMDAVGEEDEDFINFLKQFNLSGFFIAEDDDEEDTAGDGGKDEPKGNYYCVEVADVKKVYVFATNADEAEEEALAIADDYESEITRTARALHVVE